MRRRSFLKSFVALIGAALAPRALRQPEVAEGRLLAQPAYLSQGMPGSQYFDAGYVYCPYIPVYTTETISVDDFAHRRGLATQYGKVRINQGHYVVGAL